MMTTAKLLLHCPDKPGILAEVTDFITVNKGNIIYFHRKKLKIISEHSTGKNMKWIFVFISLM